MPTAIALPEVLEDWELPVPKACANAAWAAPELEIVVPRRRTLGILTAAKWLGISALLILGGLWTRATPSEVVVRFAVDACAIISMAGALVRRRFAMVAVSASVAVLYNPLAPVFGLSGGWQRAVLVALAIPFLALLIRREIQGHARADAVAIIQSETSWKNR